MELYLEFIVSKHILEIIRFKENYLIFYFHFQVFRTIVIDVFLQGREEMHTEFWWGNLKERILLEYLGVDWEDNIAIDLKVICGQCVDVAYDRDRWPASVNTVPNLLLP